MAATTPNPAALGLPDRRPMGTNGHVLLNSRNTHPVFLVPLCLLFVYCRWYCLFSLELNPPCLSFTFTLPLPLFSSSFLFLSLFFVFHYLHLISSFFLSPSFSLSLLFPSPFFPPLPERNNSNCTQRCTATRPRSWLVTPGRSEAWSGLSSLFSVSFPF